MRLTRPCLTVRRLMILVALVATSLGLYRATRRWAEFRREAAECDDDAAFQAEVAGWSRDLAREARAGDEPADVVEAEVEAAEYWVRVYERRAAHYRRWAAAWRGAAIRPWRARPRPGPLPEEPEPGAGDAPGPR